MSINQKLCINYKFLSILAVLGASHSAQGMSTTFFKPASTLPKIRFANDAFFTINSICSRSSATKSYNKHGEKSYLFDWNSPETLLNPFTNNSLPITDTTSAGKAYIDGKAITHEVAFACTKNIPKGFFFDIQIYQRYLTLKNITLVPLNSKNDPYESTEILASDNPVLADYLKTFNETYPLFNGTSNQKYMLHNSFFLAGHTRSWDHFEEIDFLDVTFKAGMFLNFNNAKEEQLLEIPILKNHGFCAECSAAIGMLNWINIGATVSTKIYSSAQQTIGLDINSIDNDFLKQHKGQATIKQNPFLYGNVYIEADHIEAGLSILVGYSYAIQQKTIVSPIDYKTFPHYLNTDQNRFQEWSIGTMIFEIEYDFATEKNLNLPLIKLSFYQPIHGAKTFKATTEAFSCCLQFSHAF